MLVSNLYGVCMNWLDSLPWIPISERLPKHTLRCLIKQVNGYIQSGEFYGADMEFCEDNGWEVIENVQFWLPIEDEE